MLGRISRLFLRYAERNLHLSRAGPPLKRGEHVLGALEEIALNAGRLCIRGKVSDEVCRVGLRLARGEDWTRPEAGAFALDLPFAPGPFELICETGSGPEVLTLPGFEAGAVARARHWLKLRYLWDVARLAPEGLRWKLKGDFAARERIKEGLNLIPPERAVLLSAAALTESASLPRPHGSATLVMPIYNAHDVLCEALARVAAHTDLDWRIVLIEDASPDARIRPLVQSWAEAQGARAHLLLNEANLGFIGAVNRGLAEAQARWPDDPVVLLNSDALVPEGWLPRLLAPLADARVATVTPMSNDAEIFTVPVICTRSALPEGAADALDRVAAELPWQAGLAEAPTGVGFCMALAPTFLARSPTLDPAFGRGYGEETDWCQKARAAGGIHVAAANLFVEHRGGESFGSAAKQALLAKNGALISARYPRYDQEVQRFITEDPLITARLALGLSHAALLAEEPVPVWLGHSMGGGAEHDLARRIAADLERGLPALVLRVGGKADWVMELHTPSGVTRAMTNDWALVRALVQRLTKRRIIYSCGVGARDPLDLPGQLLELAEGQTLEVIIHDFYPLSPSYTLLSSDGAYHGLPAAEDTDAAHQPKGGTLTDWRARWQALMERANVITVFSESSRALIAGAYPGAAAQIRVRPHALRSEIPRIAPAGTTIGVLGNIGHHKGIAVVQNLARDLEPDNGRLVVLGQTDPRWPLGPAATVHGSYELRDLPGLVARYEIGAWLIPSIWPETFSFTTHEVLATGMPVLSFDLGAQGDAVRAALAKGAPGALLPLSDRIDPAAIAPHLSRSGT